MGNLISQYESMIRLSVFAGVFILMISAETLFPKKQRVLKRMQRWSTNLSLTLISTLLVSLLFPIAAIGLAQYAQDQHWGILNVFNLPLWAHILVSIIALDFAIYVQHVASHKFPIFWRLHKVHHADRDIDATTGIRFHPVEIILSLFYKFAAICVLGPHMLGVFIFEILLNASALFNHANLSLPKSVDKILRIFIVTPDMHRVHHSVILKETNANYGFNLSIWDKIFRTYIAQPRQGHDKMTIGLAQYQSPKPSFILWCLTLPFKKGKQD